MAKGQRKSRLVRNMVILINHSLQCGGLPSVGRDSAEIVDNHAASGIRVKATLALKRVDDFITFRGLGKGKAM